MNKGIGDVIQFLKSDYPHYKVALLTNSTLLDQAEVRRQIKDADVIMAPLVKKISDFLDGADIVRYESARSDMTTGHDDLMARLVSTIRRRPYTVQDVSQIMGLDVATVQPVLIDWSIPIN